MTLQVALLTLVLAIILMDMLVLMLFRADRLDANSVEDWPRVSVLVPMRNEAMNVEGLLKSLLKLDYPKERIEILIGQDRSTDDTPNLLRKYIQLDARIAVVDITEDLQNLKAKANVIGQLIPHCTGDYYFITDADVRVPPGWLKALLHDNPENAGVIGGTTVVTDKDFWSGLQQVDWLFAQGMLYVAGKIFQVVAVSGTNMMITRKCCERVGGYQNIPYSLTEDIGALTAAKRSGYTGKNVLHQMATATIEAQPDWRSLLSQRSRWVYGVLRLPKGIVLLLLLRALFLPAVLWLACWWVWVAVAAYLLKSAINFSLIRKVGVEIGQNASWRYLLIFELYWFLMASFGLVTHLFSSGTHWKGRKYS
jgi:cellulose synthase/poly-beta-1,6-N-acetylglucosamine synthase-like glycosyltransferase